LIVNLTVRFSLIVSVLLAFSLAGPVLPSGAWSLGEESGGASAIGSGEGEDLPGGVGVAPGAQEPAPVNKELEEAFWADPPWKQAEEKAAREVAEKAAREAARRVAIARQAAEAAALRCVVPALEGKTLAAARHLLQTSHCSLGTVRGARGTHGAPVIASQTPGRGTTLSTRAPVDVRLATRGSNHGRRA
jgi:hypothetical protein